MPKSIKNMSLAELFAESDRIGDKYLDPADVAKRDAELEAIAAEVDAQVQAPLQKMHGVTQSLEALKAKCNSLLIP